MKRELKTMEVFTMASGAMISSGLFVLPGLAYAQAGPAVVLSYAIAALAMLPAMLSIAELATAMPKAGGNYLFIERSLGSFAGIFMGFADWFAIAMKSAFALVGIGALVSAFLPGNDLPVVKTVALISCVFFAALNTMSVKGTGRFQNVFVFVLLGLLAAYIAWSADDVRLDSFRPVMPHGLGPVFATAGMVFVSYGGLTKVAAASGEVM